MAASAAPGTDSLARAARGGRRERRSCGGTAPARPNGVLGDAAEPCRRTDRPLGARPLSDQRRTQENEALVRRIFDAFAQKQGFSLRECFAEHAVWHVPGTSVMAGTYRGRSEIFRFLGNLPKLTGGTYGSRLIDVLVSGERAAALYRAFGERDGRSLDIDQLLLFSIADGLVTEVLALPNDPLAFEEFWGA
ncbi:MAG: nuclear transport factor 2 family protein [Actinobacteria bacterium]|nr:nuclear transport factor 2 family protein [Actinomycetota bacterium]